MRSHHPRAVPGFTQGLWDLRWREIFLGRPPGITQGAHGTMGWEAEGIPGQGCCPPAPGTSSLFGEQSF